MKRFIAGLLVGINMFNFSGILPMQSWLVPEAHAAEEEVPNNQLGLIAILVEESLMQDPALRSQILTYAENAQGRINHSKALIIEVTKNESTFKVASLLEKLYFEGVDADLIDGNPLNNDSQFEDDNQLAGVIMIGDVPLPVVHEEDGQYLPSVYPYTDFDKKAYIYDHQTDQFEANPQTPSKTPEVWHGLINPPSKDPEEGKQQLIAFLEKNNDYTNGQNGYADFEQRLLYANFPEMEQQMNYLDYSSYQRYIDFMEEMVFRRYNKHLLKELVTRVSADLESPQPIIDDQTIDSMFDVYTEEIFKQYALSLVDALKTYRGGLNEVARGTGRWTPEQVDSPESLIALRDDYAKHQLHRSQLLLEKAVDDYLKQNIPPPERALDLVTLAKMNVKLTILDVEVDNRFFDFLSFIDGIPVSTMNSMAQCGIQVGSQKDDNMSRLEDNSVLVNANRLYNLETLLTPGENDNNWELKEQDEYKAYAGCVYNNSIANAQTQTGPQFCQPQLATQSVFDIEGSIEVKENEIAYDDENRCSLERMSFLLTNEGQYISPAAVGQVQNVVVGENLDEVINTAYNGLQGNQPNATLKEKADFVVQTLIENQQSFSYEPFVGAMIEVTILPEEKAIDSVYPHVEPTNETIKAIKQIGEPRIDPNTGELNYPQIITPSLPADGNRFVFFFKNGLPLVYEYLNLFRITGENSQEVTENLLQKMTEKQAELSVKTNSNAKLYETFFAQNPGVLEPLSWKAASLDQKLLDIIPKYVDRDSFMPTVFNNPPVSPQNKPEGYEVLHIVANGDAHGYEFGISKAMESQSPEFKTQQKVEEANFEQEALVQEEKIKEAQGGQNPQLPGQNYVCGDPSGVEIWEWFSAMECWVEEEILPKQDIFALSNACSATAIPPKEVIEALPQGTAIFDELLPQATDFEVNMPQQTMVVGQEQTLTISGLDSEKKPLLGFIDMPIRFELSNPDVGEVSENDVYIFSGSREVTFIPNAVGNTVLTVKMGDLPPQTLQIKVLDEMSLEWTAAEEKVNGRSEFLISVTAVDEQNNTLLGMAGEIVVAPENPADGGFENGGRVTLNNGTGQIRFIPAPGKAEIKLVSKDPYIKGSTIIKPSKPLATQIILKSAQNSVPLGEEVKIDVMVTDEFGFAAELFDGSIGISLSESSKNKASLAQNTVEIKNGKGSFMLKAGKETAEIGLKANHAELKPGQLTLPVVARIDSEAWKSTYPQTLFASFVGFPAGNYLEEDYFGGVHLMAGKTQAVYSFLTAPSPEATVSIEPNHLIRLASPTQIVLADFLDNQLTLQAFDTKKVQTLFTKKEILNFESVEMLPEESLEFGKMYVDILDTNYAAFTKDTGFEIKSTQNQTIAEVHQDKVVVLDPNFKWQYVTEPEFGAVELVLTDGLITPFRLILNFKTEVLSKSDFEEINPNFNWSRNYGGKSVNDPVGVTFYENTVQPTEEARDEFYGLRGDHNYISLFASGTNIGEAVRFNLPTTAILLGDPTIKLETQSNNGLNYNASTGEKIYQDPEGVQIASINHFNFNNDAYEDVAILLKDGRVRLLEGGPTEPPFKDRGSIALLADGGMALETLDLKGDGYEDLLVATEDGRLAFLSNDEEVISRSDQKINVGKQIRKLMLEDMDQDGSDDLVVLDSLGNITIFYYNPETQKYPNNGQVIGNYGFSLKLDQNLNADLDLRYEGMPEPQGLTDNQNNQSNVPLDQFEGGGEIDPQVALDFYKKLQEESEKLAQDPYAPSTTDVPKLPWPEGSEVETYFAPIESIATLGVAKNVSNKTRPGEKNVDLEEVLEYRIEISSAASLQNVVIADVVPDALTLDSKALTCVEGDCQDIQVQENGTQLFFHGLNLQAGVKTIFSYEAKVSNTPEADIFIQVVDEPNENLNNPDAIVDPYKDILVSPPFNNTGKVLIHYTTGPRSYSVVESNDPDPQPQNEAVNSIAEFFKQMENPPQGELDPNNPPEPVKLPGMEEALDDATGNNDCFEDINNPNACAEQMLDDLSQKIAESACIGGGCFPMPFNKAFLVPPEMPYPTFAYPTTVPTAVGPMPLPSTFPVLFPGAAGTKGPYSSLIRFYVSPTLTGGMGLAMCFGPYPESEAVPPPIFPIPYPPPTGNCMVRVIPAEDLYGGLCAEIADGMNRMMNLLSSGVTKIQSAINGINNNPNVPFNVQPVGPQQGAGGLEVSLAVNLGDAIKFDPPVKTFSNIHLKSFDSIGNVLADWVDRQVLEIKNKLLTLPTVSIYMPNTKTLFTSDFEKTQDRFEGWLNTMNGSAAATLDALENIGDQETVEITYQDYLTDEVRANPINLSEMVQKGVLQCKAGTYEATNVENGFQNPDCEKNAAYKNSLNATEQIAVDGFDKKNGQWILEDGVWYFAPTDNSLTPGQALRMGLQDLSGSKALQYKKTIDTQASIYNLNALEGLYDVASTLPLVKLTEKPVELKVPWLSAGEIQSYIIELQNWVIYYEQEYDRVKDKWEALKCDDLPDPNDPKSYAKNTVNCTGRKLADAFGVSFDKIIGSAKENIAVLQSYLAYPKQLASYKEQLAGYVYAIACYIEEIAQMMGGYMATIKQQLTAWAETILTIQEVIKNIKELFDIFTNFESNCETCTNDRFGNFGWWSLLGIVLPDIPVIQFPKIPDIVLDLSNIDVMLDVEIPVINIRPEPIPLPPLPYISLPDFPNVDMFFQLPALPVLPKLPELPELPELPPLPTVELPTLPPPPKLPDVGKAFRIIVPLIEKILQTWCLVKKGLAPIPEMALQNQISMMTARPAYLAPWDLLQVQAPKIALFDFGFNQVRIETVIYLGLHLDVPSKPLDELADTWNQWMAEIPATMNEAYKTYLQATEGQVQSYLDQADSFMENAALAFEQAADQYVQGWLDKNVGDPLEEADKWLANQEAEWQKFADEQGIEISYEEYYKTLNEAYEKVRQLKNEKVSQWFDENREIIQGLNYLMPSSKVFEILADDDFAEYQQEMLDLTSEKLEQLGAYGPTLLPRLYACLRYYEDCRDAQDKYFGGPNMGLSDEEIEKLIPTDVQPLQPQAMQEATDMSEESYVKAVLETEEGQQILSLFDDIKKAINELNETEMVDYTVLKEQFNVPDYEFSPRPTTADKLERMGEALMSHSEKLYAEAENLKHITDPHAIAGVLPDQALPFALASQDVPEAAPEPRMMASNLDMPKLLVNNNILPIEDEINNIQNQLKQEYQGLEEVNPMQSTAGCNADLCLPDPITQKPVPVIPAIEMLASSETLFMPSGHLVYSDGTGLYLKRDLTINENQNNTDTGKPQSFSLGEMFSKLNLDLSAPKEAINMLQSQFTENGTATFNWLPPSHPDFYGYGMEVERIISGFDANKQTNQKADVKIVLLPPDENGNAPEAFVGDRQIDYGTLVTSLESEEEATKHFGIEANNIITGASEVYFPSLNNAKINVSEVKAVYFDIAEGSGYSLEMENGFYYIKTTWFDQLARTASYNQNEVLAPQMAAGDAEPLMIDQADRYFVSIFKEKVLKATDIFTDLSGTYHYYWFVENSKEPSTGPELMIPPQTELKEIKIKLVASQDINDSASPKFEKEFILEVQAPEIYLDAEKLSEGLIAGNLSPGDDLTNDLEGIPFSVFRNRGGIWKNLGILHAQDESKAPTTPPLNDHGDKKYTFEDSYYTQGPEGAYEIQGFDQLDPSPIIFKDHEGNKVAEVWPNSGDIKVLLNGYELKALPATSSTPTRIAIVLKATQEIIGNIYFVADKGRDITVVQTALEFPNVAKEGVTLGDVDSEDTVNILPIPASAPTYPGGMAIVDVTKEKNIALINKDGSIRLMDQSYGLSIKDKNSEDEPFIFQISKANAALVDIFIQANWNKLEIDHNTQMNLSGEESKEKNGTVANLKPTNQSMLDNGDLLTNSKPKLPQSPFSDVPTTHPYFNEIVELYTSDVIRGFEDNMFRPDQPITRAEFIKIALGVTNCFDCQKATDPQIARYLTNPFPDVSPPAWFFYCVWVAKELQMITGYGDGQFKPNQNISRAEAAAVLLRQADVNIVKAPQNALNDVPDYAWYKDYVYTAVQIGLIEEQNGNVKPDQAISRGEFAFMATTLKNYRQCRLVDEDGDGNFDWWEMNHNLDPLRPDAESACACKDNPNQNDTDKDGIKDVCDLDIDGDGTLNPMCIFDEKGDFSQALLEAKESDLGEKEGVDNCLFTSNPDQIDYDNNGVGDLCEPCPCSDNPNQNDTDNDGNKDVCDTDIDNDGQKNPICMFDKNGTLDESKAESGDNCPFVKNGQQEDLNNNGTGDACEGADLCPNLPEDLDGANDTDGCPELSDELEEKEAGVYVSPGPLCGLIDYKSDIMPGDIFMTAITDTKTHQTIFSQSKELTFQ